MKSSLRQMIFAPRFAASRTCATPRSTFAFTSSDAASWMMPIVNGVFVMTWKSSRFRQGE